MLTKGPVFVFVFVFVFGFGSANASWWQSASRHQDHLHQIHNPACGPVHSYWYVLFQKIKKKSRFCDFCPLFLTSPANTRVCRWVCQRDQAHRSRPGPPSRQPGQEEHVVLCESFSCFLPSLTFLFPSDFSKPTCCFDLASKWTSLLHQITIRADISHALVGKPLV